MVIRRLSVVAVIWTLLVGCAQEPPKEFQRQFKLYIQQFYDNGRIVDTGNGQVSHSEGQGYGMLFAVKADDKSRFDEMWQWTSANLQRHDHLFSWRYRLCPTLDSRCIDDPNNASDGDILIAWALLRAYEQWGDDIYRTRALEIIDAVAKKLVFENDRYTLLLPGEKGFVSDASAVQINLSYWVFPALQAFSDTTGEPVWQQLIDSGYELIEAARFSQWQLPPDWLMITADGLSLENTVSPEYGFNACRIPLHLIWHEEDTRNLLVPFLNFWQQDTVPATVNLATGETAHYRYTPGMKAVAAVTAQLTRSDRQAEIPPVTPQLDYFSASLIMLSELAKLDRGADAR